MASGDDSGVVSGDDSGVVSGDDGSGGIFGGGTGTVDMDTPAVDGALDTWGHYYCWEDGTFVGEIDCWGDTFYCYDTDEGATAELTVEELAGGYFTFTNVETGESQNFSASDETGELRLYSADGSYLVLVDYYSVDDPFTYDPSTGGSTSAGSFDVLSGETTPIVVADRGGLTVTAELPVEWADAGEATSSSDSSGYSVDYYDAADNNLMLMVAMGSKSDIPADTLEELAAALEEQIVGSYSDLEEFGGTTDNYYTTINGTDWYVSTIEAAYDGEAAFVLACGATVDDQACVVMCAYYGDEDSAADAGAAATAMCNTLTVG